MIIKEPYRYPVDKQKTNKQTYSTTYGTSLLYSHKLFFLFKNLDKPPAKKDQETDTKQIEAGSEEKKEDSEAKKEEGGLNEEKGNENEEEKMETEPQECFI